VTSTAELPTASPAPGLAGRLRRSGRSGRTSRSNGTNGSGGSGGRFRLGRLAVRVVAVALAAGLVYLGVTFVQVWSASRSGSVRPAQAIVVLGAANYDCEPSPVLRQRLEHALTLYNDDIAPVIVTTGGKQAGDRCTEAAAGANYLRAEGVPDGNLLLEDQGRNSWESLAASARILHDRDMTRVVLVTDGYHALRVRAIADELGLEAAVSPSEGGASARDLLKETGAVAVGRIVGFRRLVNIDDRLVRTSTG
jgi:uncharacterized SAM-binding protein YcdF (DUF218 family)